MHDSVNDNWHDRANVGLLRVVDTDDHWVRVYANRLAIARNDGERMTWEELQRVKQDIWGDCVAVEIYPADKDVINLRHTRHLWHTDGLQEMVNAECQHPEFVAILRMNAAVLRTKRCKS